MELSNSSALDILHGVGVSSLKTRQASAPISGSYSTISGTYSEISGPYFEISGPYSETIEDSEILWKKIKLLRKKI